MVVQNWILFKLWSLVWNTLFKYKVDVAIVLFVISSIENMFCLRILYLSLKPSTFIIWFMPSYCLHKNGPFPAKMVTMTSKVGYVHTLCLLWICGKSHWNAMIRTHFMIKYVISYPIYNWDLSPTMWQWAVLAPHILLPYWQNRKRNQCLQNYNVYVFCRYGPRYVVLKLPIIIHEQHNSCCYWFHQ